MNVASVWLQRYGKRYAKTAKGMKRQKGKRQKGTRQKVRQKAKTVFSSKRRKGCEGHKARRASLLQVRTK